MTRYNIVEGGEQTGYVADEPGYGYEYDGANPLVRRALREQAEGGWDVETDYGPGGATDERIAEAAPGVKLERAAAVLDGVQKVELRPDEPGGGPAAKAREDNRVYVGNVHEAPDGKLVRNDSDGGLYYTEEAGDGGPGGGAAGRTAGILERLRGALDR